SSPERIAPGLQKLFDVLACRKHRRKRGPMADQMDYAIRRAGPSDAAALALVHETTWRETYVGLLSEEMLDALTADARTAAWKRILSGATDDHLSTVYVAERPGAVVAFGSCGEQRNEEFAKQGYAGEFTSV